MHQGRLPVGKRRAMSARNVALGVVAPARYHADDGLRDCLSRARDSLKSIGGYPQTRGLSMSLDALAFPEWFDRLPFSDGEEVRIARNRQQWTDPGREIVAAFDGLRTVLPHREGTRW